MWRSKIKYAYFCYGSKAQSSFSKTIFPAMSASIYENNAGFSFYIYDDDDDGDDAMLIYLRSEKMCMDA